MKFLTITQPWCWAILHGGKDVENRKWHTNYRGKLAIHAGKGGMTRELYHVVASYLEYDGFVLPPMRQIELGGIVGVVDLVDCVSEHTSPWYNGGFGFVLANPIALPFFPLRGMLGLRDVPEEWMAMAAPIIAEHERTAGMEMAV